MVIVFIVANLMIIISSMKSIVIKTNKNDAWLKSFIAEFGR